MAGKVFFSVSMSLDGFIAPASLGELMGRQWMELQAWAFPLRFFRENLKLGEGGEEGRDNDIARVGGLCFATQAAMFVAVPKAALALHGAVGGTS